MKHRIELTKELELTDEQLDALDAHSFVNIATVLGVLLQGLELAGGQCPEVGPCLDLVQQLGRLARSTRRLLAARDRVAEIADELEAMAASLGDAPGTDAERAERRYLTLTVMQVLEILRVRLAELVARADAGDAWVAHELGELRLALQQVLLTMARASRGRFGICFDPSGCGPSDYAVEIDLGAADRESIAMPGVIQDLLRDLIANARKYTEPGGRLRARLSEGPGGLEIVVSDNGRGIPATEMSSVVDFGYRAANALSRPSCGGGFGLTKAYWVVKRMAGRMWIESELGVGTRVVCAIPRRHGNHF